MLLATDLDGTLLRADGSISARTLAAIAQLRQAGLSIAIVTGRPPRWLAPAAAALGWHGLGVGANGAVVANFDDRIVEHTQPINPDALHEVTTRIRTILPDARFAAEYAQAGHPIPGAQALADAANGPRGFNPGFAAADWAGHEPGYLRGVSVPVGVPVKPVGDLITRPGLIKLLARSDAPGREPDAVWRELEDALTGLVTVTHSTPGEVLLEMSDAHTSKATGLQWLAQHHGIAREQIVAVGDMPNDLSMLTWAGRGYAVANAHEAVLAAVGPDQVVPSHTDDGVAELIDRLLAEGRGPLDN